MPSRLASLLLLRTSVRKGAPSAASARATWWPMNPVAPVRKTFMVRDQFTTDGWRLRNRLQYQQFLCSMALPELFIRRDLALLHRLRALAVEVGLPALIQHRTIAGMKGQIVAIPDSIECIEEIEAVC